MLVTTVEIVFGVFLEIGRKKHVVKSFSPYETSHRYSYLCMFKYYSCNNSKYFYHFCPLPSLGFCASFDVSRALPWKLPYNPESGAYQISEEQTEEVMKIKNTRTPVHTNTTSGGFLCFSFFLPLCCDPAGTKFHSH